MSKTKSDFQSSAVDAVPSRQQPGHTLFAIEQERELHNLREDGSGLDDTLPPPSTAVEELERWNGPNGNMWGVFGTFLSFFIVGLNDATPGAILPYLEEYYNLSYTVVSLIFLSPFVGYASAATLNNTVHLKFGQRGIAMISPLCQITTYLVVSFHPPYPVLIVIYTIGGLAAGLLDAGWSAWIGGMAGGNRMSGILNAFYSLGGTLAPLIATSMITKAHLPWYTWYYVLVGLGVFEWVYLTWAFWHKTGEVYRRQNHQSETGGQTREALKRRATWIIAIYLLAYMGLEVTLGGWIVTFMLRVRQASPYASGVSVTGFWAGQTAGRAFLGFVTERYGETVCVPIYLAISLALELVFWLVPQFVVSAVAVAFLGVFIGPLWPAGCVMCTKLLPRKLHISALGFATAIAGTGGAGLPFAVGAIAQVKGVSVLQPIVLALLVVITVLWLSLPSIRKVRNV